MAWFQSPDTALLVALRAQLSNLAVQQNSVITLLVKLVAQEATMATALADLQKGIADLGTSVSAEIAAIAAKLAAAVPPGTSDANVEAAVASLATLKATIDAETASLAEPAPAA